GGLVMLHIRDVQLGCEQLQVKKDLILGKPLYWFDLVEHYRVTTSWMPNFGFSLMVDIAEDIKRRQWDISSLKYVINAGEMVIPGTMNRFHQLTKSFGLKEGVVHPGWGMSETSSLVCISRGIKYIEFEGRIVTCLGHPIDGVEIRI